MEITARAVLYEWHVGLRADGVWLTPKKVALASNQFQRRVLEEWQVNLEGVRRGLRAIGAIRPVLLDWVDRRHGGLTFRFVQVL